MKNILPAGLLEATRLTNAGRLAEATAALQGMFGGQPMPSPGPGAPTRRQPPTIDGVAETVGEAQTRRVPGVGPKGSVGQMFPEALRGLLDQGGQRGFQLPAGAPRPSAAPVPITVPDGAQFLTATFTNQAGSRPYKLYVPSGYRPGQAAPLIVMLHGCTQSPDDFAAGTRMNEAAERHGCLVVYPGQTGAANRQKCWNWFSEADQRREAGEPSLIAGITRQVMRDYAIDPRRVYVAGLSAGGAAAAIMGDAYPDLYAAIGVHSGLACGAARDVPSAFAAMQGGGQGRQRNGIQSRIVPAIVFHGDRDATVNPRNGEQVVAQSAQAAALGTHAEAGQVPGGYGYHCTRHDDADGKTLIEQWVVHGAGHAWFGGSPAGSYTDPRGPDATKEMLRFFLDHPHPTDVPGRPARNC